MTKRSHSRCAIHFSACLVHWSVCRCTLVFCQSMCRERGYPAACAWFYARPFRLPYTVASPISILSEDYDDFSVVPALLEIGPASATVSSTFWTLERWGWRSRFPSGRLGDVD